MLLLRRVHGPIFQEMPIVVHSTPDMRIIVKLYQDTFGDILS